MAADTDVRWLNDDERATWRSLIGVVIRLPQELDRQLRRDAGISHFDYQVLARLSEAPDRTLRMSTLAGLTEGSLPRLSQVVSKLERRGWVRRSPDPDDGRFTLATLTASGRDKVVESAPGHVAAVRRLVFDSLDRTDVARLGELMEGILDAVDPEHAHLAERADH